jgi:aspartyl-tRNA(Asn)/glutamyl-tRNA(Gln) amidotransferase subunit A
MPGPAPKIGGTKDNPLFGEMMDILCSPSSLCGFPCISVPIGLNSIGLPIGMQIFGPNLKEQEVLNTAFIFESIINK